MKISLALAAGAMALTGTMAYAKEEPAPAKSDEEKLICRSEAVTGSRLKKRRTCLTAAQWEELRAASQKGLEDYQRTFGTTAGQSSANPMTGQ